MIGTRYYFQLCVSFFEKKPRFWYLQRDRSSLSSIISLFQCRKVLFWEQERYTHKTIAFYNYWNYFWSIFLSFSEIKNLIGEPDYRQVRLHWETEKSVSPEKYEVKYCELQSWGPQRCRKQNVPLPDENEIDYSENMLSYNADIKGLRMATTYSFEIRSGKDVREREDRSQTVEKNQNIIVIPTKGCKYWIHSFIDWHLSFCGKRTILSIYLISWH